MQSHIQCITNNKQKYLNMFYFEWRLQTLQSHSAISPPVFYRWKMNDSFISPQPGSRYSISGGNLRISQLNKEEDAGIYQCLASNSFGTILSREASLHIACESK